MTPFSESPEALQAYTALCDCYVNSYRAYCQKHNAGLSPAEAERQAMKMLDAFFNQHSSFNPAYASRRGMESLIDQLNAAFGLNTDPDILEDHNVTLHLFISDLQESVTLL